MRRPLEAIDRDVADRTADSRSCSSLMQDAEARANEAARALDDARAACSGATTARDRAEVAYSESPGATTAAALTDADASIRRSEILLKAAAERQAAAAQAFAVAHKAFKGNVAEIGDLRRERVSALVEADFDATSIAFARSIEATCAYASRLDTLRTSLYAPDLARVVDIGFGESRLALAFESSSELRGMGTRDTLKNILRPATGPGGVCAHLVPFVVHIVKAWQRNPISSLAPPPVELFAPKPGACALDALPPPRRTEAAAVSNAVPKPPPPSLLRRIATRVADTFVGEPCYGERVEDGTALSGIAAEVEENNRLRGEHHG